MIGSDRKVTGSVRQVTSGARQVTESADRQCRYTGSRQSIYAVPVYVEKCFEIPRQSVLFIYLFCFTPLKGEIHTNTTHTTTKVRKLKDAGDCNLQTKA